MNRNSTLIRVLSVLLATLMLLTAAALLPISAAETATVYISDDFEQYGVTNGNVPDKYISASFSGSTNYAIVQENALSGNRSALINNHIDWRWWSMNVTAETVTIEYRINVQPSDSLEFTTCMTISSDASTSNEGLGGCLVVFKGNGTDLGVYDRNSNLITELDYNTSYAVKLNISARSDTFSMEIGGETYKDLPFASAVYTITAFRLNATAGSSFYFDDFKVYSTSRTYPQTYSAQEPGAMVELDYPTYYEPDGITVWLNRDATDAGKGALQLDIPVKEANNTLYLPYDKVRELIATGETTELEPMLITWDGVAYISIQDTAALTGSRVWWDEAEGMVVFTDGDRLADGILRSINGRFYMNGQPYYEISFNKFDIAAQILINYFPDNFRDFNTGEDQRANAERALAELRDNGFTSIRFFSYVDSYDMIHDPVESEKYWQGLDELFDLCDKYGIKIVPSLCCGSSLMTACEYVEGLGYVSVGEDRIDLITDPESKSRAFQQAYIETYVNRYKDRDTVLMWEINNEMNLDMDVGPSIGKVTYSAYQLSEFFAWCTSIINECDPDRLVTSGDSVQRNVNYHLLAGTMAGRDTNDWTTDTYAQRLYMNYLLHGLGGLDVTSVHAYGENTNDLHIKAERINTTANRMSLSIMVDEARALGQPLYVGEAGTGTANGNTDYEAIQNTLDGYVELGLQLVHWWSYDTCRLPAFNDDSSWNMNMTDFAESVALVKAANEALKSKWLVNRADEDVAITNLGDQAVTIPTETTTPVDTSDGTPTDTTHASTTSTDTSTAGGDSDHDSDVAKSGCRSAVSVIWVLPISVLTALTVVRKKREE